MALSPEVAGSTFWEIYLIRLLFIITRTLWACKQLYFSLLYLNLFENIHGPLEEFDYYELLLWFIGYFTIIGQEVICQNLSWVPSVLSSFNLWDRIWNQLLPRVSSKESKVIRKSLSVSVARLCLQFW